jgi:tRNA pseudouridine55 synthase
VPDPVGVAVVDKPAGWTSHDVVAKARGLLGTRRVGHAGTLDPDATGVLVLGVGRATRLLKYLAGLDKRYVGEVVLGTATSTLDATGEVTGTWDMAGVDLPRVREAAAGLTGAIDQVPPMVSALKVGGRRLHELAREGVEVDRAPRPVVVHRFAVEPTGEPLVYRIAVDCSAGTYIRSLAADLGHLLGGGAHLRRLRRTAVGTFTTAEARSLDALELLAPRTAVRDLPAVTVDAATAARIGHGAILDRPADGATGPWAMVDADGELLAVYEAHGTAAVKPAVVLTAG